MFCLYSIVFIVDLLELLYNYYKIVQIDMMILSTNKIKINSYYNIATIDTIIPSLSFLRISYSMMCEQGNAYLSGQSLRQNIIL